MRRWSRDGYHVQHWAALLSDTNTGLYAGRGAQVLARVEREWRALQRSLLLTLRVPRIEALGCLGRAALAAAEQGGDRRRLLKIAERSSRRMAGERMVHARAQAALQRAGAAALRDQPERAVALLEQAAADFDRALMPVHAAATRRHQGRLVGGTAGAALVAGADALMRAEAIARPDRFAAMLAPGFTRAG
jgi:hypothetical protein